jgi:hypothetical protein
MKMRRRGITDSYTLYTLHNHAAPIFGRTKEDDRNLRVFMIVPLTLVPYFRRNAPICFYQQQKTRKGVVGIMRTIVKWAIVRKIVRKKAAAYASVLL